MGVLFSRMNIAHARIFLITAAVFLCALLASPPAYAAPPPSCGGTGIFAGVMCTLETTLDNITQKLFTAIANEMKGAVVAALTLFIILFALSFLAGIINLTAREFTVALFKFGLVWAFAVTWNNGAGLAYEFFKTFAVSGGDMVWKAVGGPGSGIGGITSIDSTITNAVGNTASSADTGATITYTSTDPGPPPTTVTRTIQPLCVAQLSALAIMLFIMQPPLFAIVIIYVYNLIKLFATAILYYFKSLVLISFLIVMAPIFISFGLFQRTRELFETWLKHLGTNALQMLIMFAFFAMVLLVDFASFFADFFGLFRIWNPLGVFTNLANAVSHNLGFGAVNVQAGFCSLCNYQVSPDYQNIWCVSNDPTDPNYGAIPPFAIPFQFDFWMWLATKVIALQILSYILTDFLEKAPTIAQQLGGVRYGGLLAGSGRNPGFAGYTNFGFSVIEGGAAAFMKAQRNAYYRPGIIGAIPLIGGMRNPLKMGTHAKNTLQSVGAGLGLMEGINERLSPYEREVDDYSKRALESKRAMQKAEKILNHHKQLEKDGKVPRAALVSAQNAYNQSVVNSKRWERKLEESRAKLDEQAAKHGTGGGAIGMIRKAARGGGIDAEYEKTITREKIKQEHDSMFYFLPAGTGGESYEQQELHRLNLESMQTYGQSKASELSLKLEQAGDKVSAYERSRLEREIASASSDLNSGDADRAAQALDALKSVSRDLD